MNRRSFLAWCGGLVAAGLGRVGLGRAHCADVPVITEVDVKGMYRIETVELHNPPNDIWTPNGPIWLPTRVHVEGFLMSCKLSDGTQYIRSFGPQDGPKEIHRLIGKPVPAEWLASSNG